MKNKLFLILTFWLCLVVIPGVGHYLTGAESQVSISLSDNLGLIGDEFKLKILVTTATLVDDIKIKIEKSDFEIQEQQKTQQNQQSGYTTFDKTLVLAFYKTGNFEVGPFTIELIKGGTVVETHTTNSVPVTIKSSLTEKDKDIKPLKGLMEVKGDPMYVLKFVIGGLILIGLIIAFFVWRKIRRGAVATPPTPPLTALEELESRIRDLAALKLTEKGKLKVHFIELTQILKHFLLRYYGFNAEDFTTYETMCYLIRYEKEVSIQDNLRFVFNTSDLVKFAKFVPDVPVLQEVDEKLKEIIISYKLRIPVPGQTEMVEERTK